MISVLCPRPLGVPGALGGEDRRGPRKAVVVRGRHSNNLRSTGSNAFGMGLMGVPRERAAAPGPSSSGLEAPACASGALAVVAESDDRPMRCPTWLDCR